MRVAERLAEFVVEFEVARVPEHAIEHAAMLVASTLASAAAGVGIGSARAAREVALADGGRPEATVWFEAVPSLPAARAAQVNAVASDAAACDDSDLRNIVHPGTVLVAAALAAGERAHAPGRAVLEAIVLGYEVVGRIGAAMTPGFVERGHHGSCCAIFGATAVSGRLAGLRTEEMAQALALSATSVGGLVAAANTSTAREHHAGLAAQLGTYAAAAAGRGFLAETAIFEGPGGFFETIGGVDATRAARAVTEDLGDDWDIITDMAIKLMPGGHPFHAIGEASAEAARAGDVDPDEVERIEVYRPTTSAFETGPSHPHDLVTMAHSPAYFAAAGVADRTVSWEHAGPEKIADPRIHALIDRVRPGTAPEGDRPEAYRQGATVRIVLRDGRDVSSTVHVPRGSGELGISWDDVDDKYRRLVASCGLSADRIAESLACAHDLALLADVSRLLRLVASGR